ncbi:Sugar phosphate permease [Caldanaerobius fijiensis DSM 17918]|uniref:Sugar phosphate permease n=1 Tax=Caldanaerobius fijiensis DSM 17918 TaxID=1121256 RepID=A0A1M5BR43_9THEO|nr:MFS transporter [Caldanaerobius fijiensis]SHF44915.1 Sugar phosphate permease [Caldanaerobius fijiensis DSM 17918]
MLKEIYSRFKSINNNARVIIAVGPLINIPISMFMTYATIYMSKLGLTAEQIGIISSISLLAQLINSFYAGILTNKLGRKRTITIFDTIAWSFACLVWAFSKSFTAFLLAALLNSFVKVSEIAWRCILVDDSSPQERIVIWSFQNIVFVIGGLFVPLGGILVSHYGVVFATRIMYIIGFVAMSIGIFIRYANITETSIGIMMMQKNKNGGYKEVMKDVLDAIKYILTHPENLLLLTIVVLNNFQFILKNTYNNLYLISHLKISDRMVSIFPAISTIMTLIAMFVIIPKMGRSNEKKALLIGLALTSLSNLLFVLSPPKQIGMLILTTLIGSVGFAVMSPNLETCWANSIDDKKRANVVSYSSILITAISIPAGAIGGYIYTINPVMLFILIFALSLLTCVIGWMILRADKKTVGNRLHGIST